MTAAPKRKRRPRQAPPAEPAAPSPRKRIDVWLECFDGTYRLMLGTAQVNELEAKLGGPDRQGVHQPRGLFALFGAVAAGRYALGGNPVEGQATVRECRETIRQALIGGGVAVVDDAEVPVNAALANRLIANYLETAPAQETWDMAFVILLTAVEGRDETESERASNPGPGPLRPMRP